MDPEVLSPAGPWPSPAGPDFEAGPETVAGDLWCLFRLEDCFSGRILYIFRDFSSDFWVIFRSKMVDFELGPECRPELFGVYLGILTRGTNGTGDQGGGPGGLGTEG